MSGPGVTNIVLLETNPFYLLAKAGPDDAFAEAMDLRNCIKKFGALGEWATAAERFSDYWNGKGTWQEMPSDRRVAFAEALKPNFFEWDAVMTKLHPRPNGPPYFHETPYYVRSRNWHAYTALVLGQIIVAQEAIQTEPLLPTGFMRRLLTFYGDTLRTLSGCYLDFSLLTINNESMRNRMAEAGSSALKLVDEQVQQNIRFVENMLLNFTPSRPAANSNEPAKHGRTNHTDSESRR